MFASQTKSETNANERQDALQAANGKSLPSTNRKNVTNIMIRVFLNVSPLFFSEFQQKWLRSVNCSAAFWMMNCRSYSISSWTRMIASCPSRAFEVISSTPACDGKTIDSIQFELLRFFSVFRIQQLQWTWQYTTVSNPFHRRLDTFPIIEINN